MLKLSCKGILDNWCRKVLEDIIYHEKQRKLAVKKNMADLQGKNDLNLAKFQTKRVLKW